MKCRTALRMLLLALFVALPGSVRGDFIVNVGGTILRPRPGENFVDLTRAGIPGFNITPMLEGTTARVFFEDTNAIDRLVLTDVTIARTGPGRGTGTITFQREFEPGPIGAVNAVVGLDGFFATATGVGVPARDSITFKGLLNGVRIGQDLMHTVPQFGPGDFNLSANQNRVLGGIKRTLRGELTFTLAAGDSVTLPGSASITVVPEPASITLLGIGSLGLVGYGWRRLRRSHSTDASAGIQEDAWPM